MRSCERKINFEKKIAYRFLSKLKYDTYVMILNFYHLKKWACNWLRFYGEGGGHMTKGSVS